MYTGHVYPEVIEYFEKEGFIVRPVKSDALTAKTNGIPVYLFTVSDEIVLSEEEIKREFFYKY